MGSNQRTDPHYSRTNRSPSTRSSQPPPPPIRRTLPTTRGTPAQKVPSSGTVDEYLPPATCAVTPRILAHQEALAASKTSKVLGQEEWPAEEVHAVSICEETEVKL